MTLKLHSPRRPDCCAPSTFSAPSQHPGPPLQLRLSSQFLFFPKGHPLPHQATFKNLMIPVPTSPNLPTCGPETLH